MNDECNEGLKDYSLEQFSQDLYKKQKEKAVRLIIESIKLSLMPIPKNMGKVYTYWDIVDGARPATYMGDDTYECVDVALERLQLTEEFPK